MRKLLVLLFSIPIITSCAPFTSFMTTTILPDGSRENIIACSQSGNSEIKCRKELAKHCPFGHKEKGTTTTITKTNYFNITAIAIRFECKDKEQEKKEN